jgi:hypothetical protein
VQRIHSFVSYILSDAMFVISLLVARTASNSEGLVAIGNGFLYGAVLLPLVTPSI